MSWCSRALFATAPPTAPAPAPISAPCRRPPASRAAHKFRGWARCIAGPNHALSKKHFRLNPRCLSLSDTAVGTGCVWRRGLIVILGAQRAVFLQQLALDVGPDIVAGVSGLKQAARGLGDGFQITDEGQRVRIFGEQLLEARVFTQLAFGAGEEFRKMLLKLFGPEVVEIDLAGRTHFATSGTGSGCAACVSRRSSRRRRRAL